MKKICILTALIFSISFQAQAQNASTTINGTQVNAEEILKKAFTKSLKNNKGELAPGDTSKEVFGFKNGFLDIELKVTAQSGSNALQTHTKTSLQSQSKINPTTKTKISNIAITNTPVVNNVDGQTDLIRIINKSVKGNLLETYIETTVGEEKVYNVWKKNVVKDAIDDLVTSKDVPPTLKNTILKKIVSKKYIKLNKSEIQKGLLSALGLDGDVSMITQMQDLYTKNSASINAGFSKFLKVKRYLGVINDEDKELFSSGKTITTLTPLHNMVLSVDYSALAEEAIRTNKVEEYSFGFISDSGLTDDQIRKSFEYIFANLEIIIWVNTKTYAIKSFKVEPYEVYLNIGNGVKLTNEIAINYRENITSPTGYVYPAPKTFITPKEIRGMFSKYE